MLENFIYMLPIIILLLGIGMFSVVNFKEDKNSKCFRISRTVLALSFILTVIFYNKPLIAGITSANRYLLFFQTILYGGAFLILYLSRQWFSGAKISGHRFCYGVLLMVLAGDLLIVSRYLALTAGAMILLMFGHIWFLRDSGGKKQQNTGVAVYLVSATVCTAVLVTVTVLLFLMYHTSDYTKLAYYIAAERHNIFVFAMVVALIFCFLFLCGAAPLHYWRTEILDNVGLPTFACFLTVPMSACLAGFLRLNLKLLPYLTPSLSLFYAGVALISVTIGAIGASSCRNVRKILAYSTVLQTGIILLILQQFTAQTIFAATLYWFVFILTVWGLCTILFGLKNKGDYLFMLSEFAGLGKRHAFAAAWLVIFLFSLLGFPPFIGFFSLFTVLNNLVAYHHYYQLLYLLAMLLILGYAYLQIVKTIYFEDSKEIFDRTDTGIYVVLLLILLIMIAFVFKSVSWIENIGLVTEAIAA